MKKAKEEYLAMRPPHLLYERWVKEVERAFSPDAWKDWTEEEKEEYLNKVFFTKPMSIYKRWRMDAEMYREESEAQKSRFRKQ